MPPGGLRSAILVVLAALTGGCSATNARHDPPSTPQELAGCYRLELWPGESGPDMERRRGAWGSAPIVQLDTARLTAWPNLTERYGVVFVAASITEAGEIRDHPFNYWRLTAGDSLYVGHPGALAGVSMELHIEGADLRGVISSFSDVRVGRPSTVTIPVRAQRVDCPRSGR